MSNLTKEEEFLFACRRHDLTYSYSDSHSTWRSGADSYDKIRRMSKELPREVAVRIWNQVVDEKVGTNGRDIFYWSI